MNPFASLPLVPALAVLRWRFRAVLAAPADPRLTSWLITVPSAKIRASTRRRRQETPRRRHHLEPRAGRAGDAFRRRRDAGFPLGQLGLPALLRPRLPCDGPWYLNATRPAVPQFPVNQNVFLPHPVPPTVAATKIASPAAWRCIGYFRRRRRALRQPRHLFLRHRQRAGRRSRANGLRRRRRAWNRDAYFNEGVTFDAAYAHQAGPNATCQQPRSATSSTDHRVEFNATTKSYAGEHRARDAPLAGFSAGRTTATALRPACMRAMDATSLRRMISGYVSAAAPAAPPTSPPPAAPRSAAAARTAATLPANLTGPAVTPHPHATGACYLEDFSTTSRRPSARRRAPDFDLDIYNGRFCVTPEFPDGTRRTAASIGPMAPQVPTTSAAGSTQHASASARRVNAINETVANRARRPGFGD